MAKPKNKVKLWNPAVACLIIGVLAIAAFAFFSLHKDNKKKLIADRVVSQGKYQEGRQRGKVKVIDYAPLSYQGNIPIEIIVDQGNEVEPETTYNYLIGTGDCSQSNFLEMQARSIQPGDLIEIQAKLTNFEVKDGEAVENVGFYLVCDEGTFIKKLDPSAESGDNSIMKEWVTVRGSIISLDLESMDNRGTAGSIKVRSNSGEPYEIIIFSKRYLNGPSLCERPELPSGLAENKTVEVRGELGNHPDGLKGLTVCARETYVKVY